MKLRQSFDRRAGYIAASLGLLFTTMASAAFPAFAGATGLLETRSIAMTSSASAATGVSYTLKFTSENPITTGGAVIEFCDNNPLIGLACDDSSTADVNVASATLGAVTYDGTPASSAGSIAVSTDSHATHTGSPVNNVVTWTAGAGYSAGQVVSITLNSVTNPTITSGNANSTVYARVTTYGSSSDLSGWTQDTTVGSPADEGGVALGITQSLGVTAYVEESMTFCVSKDNGSNAPTANCGGISSGDSNPSMTLGEAISGGGQALDSGHVSTGLDWVQLSTNASAGAVVNLKNDTSCGGLKRSTASGCDISGQNDFSTPGDIAAGDAKFGLKTGSTSSATGGTASGTLEAANHYGSSHYFLDYNSGTPTTAGVTSPYGSTLLDTAGAPVSNKNMPITFAASVSNTTPAGIYQATLHMIATGTF